MRGLVLFLFCLFCGVVEVPWLVGMWGGRREGGRREGGRAERLVLGGDGSVVRFASVPFSAGCR